jgi:hypothetical protein
MRIIHPSRPKTKLNGHRFNWALGVYTKILYRKCILFYILACWSNTIRALHDPLMLLYCFSSKSFSGENIPRVPNVVGQWLAILLLIREVLSSNLGPVIGYLNESFSWFSSVPLGKCQYNLKFCNICFLPSPFQLSSLAYHRIIPRYIIFLSI